MVVLTGAGTAFSAGGDMELITRTAQDEDYRYESMYHARRIVTEMMAFPLPVIAAVNGPAVGLGCSIAFLSDIVYASEGRSSPTHTCRSGWSPPTAARSAGRC